MRLMMPNKPVEYFASDPNIWDKFIGSWIGQQKLDGHRTLIVKDTTGQILSYGGNKAWVRGSNLYFLSRRDLVKGGPTKIPVKEEIVKAIEALDLPDQSMLDGEWLARRTIGEIPETLFLFDVMWYKDEWQGKYPLRDRLNILEKIVSGKLNEYIRIPESFTADFKTAFDSQKKISWTEGLVLKQLDSTIISDRKECVKNPSWVKVKWRSGHDGRDIVFGTE